MLLEKSYYLIVREHVSHLKRRIGYLPEEIYRYQL